MPEGMGGRDAAGLPPSAAEPGGRRRLRREPAGGAGCGPAGAGPAFPGREAASAPGRGDARARHAPHGSSFGMAPALPPPRPSLWELGGGGWGCLCLCALSWEGEEGIYDAAAHSARMIL